MRNLFKSFGSHPQKNSMNRFPRAKKTNDNSKDTNINELEASIEELEGRKKNIEEKIKELEDNIKELEDNKEALVTEIGNLTSQKTNLQKESEKLAGKIQVQSSKLNDIEIKEELKNNDTSSAPLETLSLFATIYSTLTTLENSSNVVNLIEEIKSHLNSLGYEFVPYSEVNKDCYFVRETGVEKNIRTAIREQSTGEIIISGEIYKKSL